jgi:hypothetical protein
MPYKYIPEKWRPKFKEGQKIWYVDHINNCVVSGIFDEYEPIKREYEDTVWVRDNNPLGFRHAVLDAWVFPEDKKADAETVVQNMIKRQIKEAEYKIHSLKKKLVE